MSTTIHRGEHFSVQHHRASGYVCVVRSKTPFASVTDAIDGLSACRAVLQGIERSCHGVLFDWRRSPISTDPTLHKALAQQMDKLAEAFTRCAILLATTVGTMQASRVGRTLGNQKMLVFDDESAAIAYVTMA